jgi:hypothetical protein
MIEHVFLYDRSDDSATMLPAYIADRRWHQTDAGARLDQFIVEAVSRNAALDAARRWVACWEDENEESVPDDLGLIEREWKPGKTYMALRHHFD